MRLMLALALAIAVLGPTPAVVHVRAVADCGLTPLKPLPPLGCDDLAPVCICDSRGERCRWEWVCVRK